MLAESRPAITAGKHVTCINQHQPDVTLTCDVRYRGSDMMRLRMTWAASNAPLPNSRPVKSFVLSG